MADLESLLKHIIAQPKLHALWLNTLSYLENCGARKIAAVEHPTLVKKEMLKHAAEEFRHAHYLKSQLSKIPAPSPKNYTLDEMIGGVFSLRYLDRLEASICRKVKSELPLYPLVTYAIEKRAEKFYPLYQKLLKEASSKISVMSIIKEEEGHLEEMEKELQGLEHYQKLVCEIEEDYYQKWINKISSECHQMAC